MPHHQKKEEWKLAAKVRKNEKNPTIAAFLQT
jgi:hypothetical protein